jgi:undecaprenyl-diphosphatase
MSVATTIVDYVATHPQIAYGMTFALALSEAIPILGAVVPGSALIIGIAALVPTGAVKLWPLMVAAVLGAIAGDGFSFWLGHRYQDAILLRWPLNHAQHPIEKSRAFLQRHGGKSVFLARFLPAVRAFVPLAAGILQMPMRHFYVANVLSALVWAPAHILPGVLVGASFSLAGPAAGRLVILLVVLLVLLWIGVWATRLAVHQGPPLLAKLQQRLWLWAGVRDTWLRRHVRALVDPDRTETRALVMWAAVVLAAAGTFFAILEDVVTGDPLVRADVAVYHALQDLRTPLGDAVMIAITEMGDTAVTLTMTLVILASLVWQGARRTAAYWVAAVGFAAALNTAIKAAIHRARPGELAYSTASPDPSSGRQIHCGSDSR